MNKVIYKIRGMHCPSCATMIELDLEDAGIAGKCSYQNQTVEIDGAHDKKKIVGVIEKSGYSVS